jgi:hypothetical protein
MTCRLLPFARWLDREAHSVFQPIRYSRNPYKLLPQEKNKKLGKRFRDCVDRGGEHFNSFKDRETMSLHRKQGFP